MQTDKIEILAPAGGFDSVLAAVRSGADAVYLGEKEFSARSSAHNFDEGELKEAVAYCHANGMEIAFTSPGWIREEVFEELHIPSPSCGACLSNMAVTPGGNVVPCQSWLSDEPLGHMLKDDWETIWNSPVCEERRAYSADMTGECPLRRCC